MTQHKWHKEIKAWADGAEIECKFNYIKDEWEVDDLPEWSNNDCDFRIKPQPEEPKYLYVYFDTYVNRVAFTTEEKSDVRTYRFLGRIKLEVGDEPVHST